MSAPSYSSVRTLPAATSVLHVRADNSTPKHHPSFSFPDADVTLRSNQGTLYRIHSYTLRTTSGFFATMFSLPQPKRSCTLQHEGRADRLLGSSDILDVYENDFPLEILLKLMSGFPIQQWSSLAELEKVLKLAEKWDTPGPISSLRLSLTAKQFLERHPLQCYAIARHFGWDAEAKICSTHTLVLDLFDASHTPIINQMTSKDFLRLVEFHRKRRDLFRKLLDSPERFAAGNSFPYHCDSCGVTVLENHHWKVFKHAMFLEMERRPLGDTLGVVVGETADWPEARACWEARCTKPDCGGLNYDRVATLRQIQACVALLPLTVDM